MDQASNKRFVSGKDLRIMRMELKVSREKLARCMGRSEQRLAQIERKSSVRPDAVKRYRAGLEAAVKIRRVIHGMKEAADGH